MAIYTPLLDRGGLMIWSRRKPRPQQALARQLLTRWRPACCVLIGTVDLYYNKSKISWQPHPSLYKTVVLVNSFCCQVRNSCIFSHFKRFPIFSFMISTARYCVLNHFYFPLLISCFLPFSAFRITACCPIAFMIY